MSEPDKVVMNLIDIIENGKPIYKMATTSGTKEK